VAIIEFVPSSGYPNPGRPPTVSVMKSLRLLAAVVVALLAGCTADEPPVSRDAVATSPVPPGRALRADLVRVDGGTVTFAAVLGEPARDLAKLPADYPDPTSCGSEPARDLFVPLTMHGVTDIDLVEFLMTVEGPAPVAVAVRYGGGDTTCLSGTDDKPIPFGARWSNAAQPGMDYIHKVVIVVRGVSDQDKDKVLRQTLLKPIETVPEEGRPLYRPQNCRPGPCTAGFPLVD
jgi:hypothetical protein